MTEWDRVVLGDCLEGMRSLPDKCFPLIVTDPPYGIGYDPGHPKDKKPGYDFSWDDNFDAKPYIQEMWRLLQDDGVLYVFGRYDTYNDYGMTPDCILIWDKMDYQQGDLAWWSTSYEFIYVFRKNKGKSSWDPPKRPTGMIRAWKVQNFKAEEIKDNMNGDYMLHPTQKPKKVIRTILECHNVDLVFDPFMGSGTTAIVCKEMGKHFFGFEKEKTYWDIIQKRLSQHNLQKWF